jgi:hypothetical protein
MEGVNCLDCHMPRVTQGLDSLVRTHRIGLPVETAMVAAGAANACNLCHLDKSIRWTLKELERGWRQRIEIDPAWAAVYGGSLDRPVGEAWLESENTAMRLVAAQSYARSPLGKNKLVELFRALNDPEPLNRLFATFAVEQVLGRKLSSDQINITAPPARRLRQIEALRQALEQR